MAPTLWPNWPTYYTGIIHPEVHLLLRAQVQMNKHSCILMYDARWIQAENNCRPPGKPWSGYDMDLASLKLWLLSMTSACLLIPGSCRFLSASEPNGWEPLLLPAVPLFHVLVYNLLLLRPIRANLINLFSLPPKSCWILMESHHLPLHSASLSAPCVCACPSLHFHPPASVP